MTVRGVNIHPSIAKGRMTNAVRAAGRVCRPFAARWPIAGDDRGPRGVLAPLRNQRRGGRSEHEDPAPRFRGGNDSRSWPIGCGRRPRRFVASFPPRRSPCISSGNIATWPRGWAGNRAPWPMPNKPCDALGRTPKLTIVRGGTDGSRLSELGLPTPNLSCGQHNPHSPLEWACLEEMAESVQWLMALAETWGKE